MTLTSESSFKHCCKSHTLTSECTIDDVHLANNCLLGPKLATQMRKKRHRSDDELAEQALD